MTVTLITLALAAAGFVWGKLRADVVALLALLVLALSGGITVGEALSGFATPFSTPPNALVMPVGQYKFMDYIKVGLPLQVLLGLLMIFVLPLIFPY